MNKHKDINVKLKRDVYQRLLEENPHISDNHVAWGYASKVITSFPKGWNVVIKGSV